MPKYKTHIWCIAFFAGAFYLINYSAKQEIQELEKWPESIVKRNYSYCTPQKLEKCSTGDWIGFLDSKLPAFSKGTTPESNRDLRYVYCEQFDIPPPSKKYRIIKINNNDTLYLCRLDEDKNILKKMENIIKPKN